MSREGMIFLLNRMWNDTNSHMVIIAMSRFHLDVLLNYGFEVI